MWSRIAIVLALLAVAPAAQAGPLNLYAGVSLGDRADFDLGDLDLDLDGVDTDDQTWKIFGGVGIGRIFAVEGAWHDFGSVSCCGQVADAGFDVDAEGLSVAVMAGLPISRLRFFAKVGLLAWEVDGESETIAGPVPFSIEGEDLMGGVGVDLKLFGSLSVRAEWEIFKIDDDTPDIVSVGVQYRFW